MAYCGLFPANYVQFRRDGEGRQMAKIFISCSHADEELCNELEKHLAALRHQGVITVWHVRRIEPGEELDCP